MIERWYIAREYSSGSITNQRYPVDGLTVEAAIRFKQEWLSMHWVMVF